MSGADEKTRQVLFPALFKGFGINLPEKDQAAPIAPIDENLSPLEKIAAEEAQIRARMEARKKKGIADTSQLSSLLGRG